MISSRPVRSISTAALRLRASLLTKNRSFRAATTKRATNAQILRNVFIRRVRNAQSSSSARWTKAATGAALLTAALGISWTSCDAPFRVKQNYDVIKLLGEGAYGRVFLAKRKSDGTTVALKAIARDAISQEEFRNEVKALQRLSQNGGHPHICLLYDLHDDGNKFYYLALELVSGGELFEHLIKHGPYSEAQAAVFLRQFAEAMSFMHSNGVIHADLKPENLMMSTEDDNLAQLKVVDFGCAIMEDNASSAKQREADNEEILGTIAYWSPELLEKGSKPTEVSDMWAIGCILYILVTGTHPFDPMGCSTDDEMAENIRKAKNGQYVIFDERVKVLSDSCVELMKALLQSDPSKRMTSDEFRRHPWAQGLSASWNTMTDSDRKLESYWQKRFRAEILRRYAKAKSRTGDSSLSDENLKDIFRSMDLDGNGTLEHEEIRIALRGLGVKDKDISDIVRSIDLDGNGTIDLDEFCTIMRKQFDNGPGVKVYHRQKWFRTKILQKFNGSSADDAPASEQKLKEIFHAIDLDGNGVLDPHEIRIVLRSVGVSEQDISQIIASCDLDRSGGVDWEEFRTIMNNKL